MISALGVRLLSPALRLVDHGSLASPLRSVLEKRFDTCRYYARENCTVSNKSKLKLVSLAGAFSELSATADQKLIYCAVAVVLVVSRQLT
jgi:hypothetical protein